MQQPHTVRQYRTSSSSVHLLPTGQRVVTLYVRVSVSVSVSLSLSVSVSVSVSVSLALSRCLYLSVSVCMSVSPSLCDSLFSCSPATVEAYCFSVQNVVAAYTLIVPYIA
eukprot:3082588-Rhodomonas_salina.1